MAYSTSARIPLEAYAGGGTIPSWSGTAITNALTGFFAGNAASDGLVHNDVVLPPAARIAAGYLPQISLAVPNGGRFKISMDATTAPEISANTSPALEFYAVPPSTWNGVAITNPMAVSALGIAPLTNLEDYPGPYWNGSSNSVAGDASQVSAPYNTVSTVTVADSTGALVGPFKKSTLIKIISDDPDIFAKNSPSSSKYCMLGEFAHIVGATWNGSTAATTTLYLNQMLDDHYLYQTNVRLVIMPDARVDFDIGQGAYNASSALGSTNSQELGIIRLWGLRDCRIRDFGTDTCLSSALELFGCYMTYVDGMSGRNGRNDQVLSHHSYAVNDYSFGTHITGLAAINYRHGYTSNSYPISAGSQSPAQRYHLYGRTRNAVIVGAAVQGNSNSGIDTHDEIDGLSVAGAAISGNYQGNNSDGPAISMRGRNISHTGVIANRCRAGAYIQTYRAGTLNASQFRNCQIAALLFQTGTSTLAESVEGEVNDCIFETTGSLGQSPVWIKNSGMSLGNRIKATIRNSTVILSAQGTAVSKIVNIDAIPDSYAGAAYFEVDEVFYNLVVGGNSATSGTSTSGSGSTVPVGLVGGQSSSTITPDAITISGTGLPSAVTSATFYAFKPAVTPFTLTNKRIIGLASSAANAEIGVVSYLTFANWFTTTGTFYGPINSGITLTDISQSNATSSSAVIPWRNTRVIIDNLTIDTTNCRDIFTNAPGGIVVDSTFYGNLTENSQITITNGTGTVPGGIVSGGSYYAYKPGLRDVGFGIGRNAANSAINANTIALSSAQVPALSSITVPLACIVDGTFYGQVATGDAIAWTGSLPSSVSSPVYAIVTNQAPTQGQATTQNEAPVITFALSAANAKAGTSITTTAAVIAGLGSVSLQDTSASGSPTSSTCYLTAPGTGCTTPIYFQSQAVTGTFTIALSGFANATTTTFDVPHIGAIFECDDPTTFIRVNGLRIRPGVVPISSLLATTQSTAYNDIQIDGIDWDAAPGMIGVLAPNVNETGAYGYSATPWNVSLTQFPNFKSRGRIHYSILSSGVYTDYYENTSVFQATAAASTEMGFGGRLDPVVTGYLTSSSDITVGSWSTNKYYRGQQYNIVNNNTSTGTLYCTSGPNHFQIPPKGSYQCVCGNGLAFYTLSGSGLGRPIFSVTSAYTAIIPDDGNKIWYLNSSSTTVITLPNTAPVGWNFDWLQIGAGKFTFSAASGATLEAAGSVYSTGGQYAAGSVRCVSNTGTAAVYVLSGTIQA